MVKYMIDNLSSSMYLQLFFISSEMKGGRGGGGVPKDNSFRKGGTTALLNILEYLKNLLVYTNTGNQKH